MRKLAQKGISYLLILVVALGLLSSIPASASETASSCLFGKAVSVKDVNWSDENILMVTRPKPLPQDSDFTVDFEVYQNSRKDFVNPMLFSSGNRLQIFVEAGSVGEENKIAVVFGDGTNNKFYVGPEIAVGKWHHIAVTFKSQGTNTGNAALHVDGSTYNIGSVPFADNHSIIELGGSYFDGSFDELAGAARLVYSQTDPTYTLPTKPYPQYPQISMLFHFDGDLTDSSGKGNVAQANGTYSFIDSTVGCPAPTPTPTPTPTPIPTQPDLIITSMDILNPPMKAGYWTYFEILVKNQGAKYLGSSNVYMNITGADGSTPTSCEAGLPSIGAGESTIVQLYCISYKNGTHTGVATVDYNNNIAESNEDNNQMSLDFFVY